MAEVEVAHEEAVPEAEKIVVMNAETEGISLGIVAVVEIAAGNFRTFFLFSGNKKVTS